MGPNPYGVIQLEYRDIKNAGYIGRIEEEEGNQSHVSISPDPESKLTKGAKSQKLCDVSRVVRPWGRQPIDGNDASKG